MEEVIKQLGDKIDTFKNETVSKADYDALKTQLEDLKANGIEKSAIDALVSKLDELGLEFTEMKTKGNATKENPFAELEQLLVDKADVIKAQKTQGNIANITLKAVGPVLTTNVTSQAGGNIVAMTQSTGELYATPENRLFAESIMNGMRVDLDKDYFYRLPVKHSLQIFQT